MKRGNKSKEDVKTDSKLTDLAKPNKPKDDPKLGEDGFPTGPPEETKPEDPEEFVNFACNNCGRTTRIRLGQRTTLCCSMCGSSLMKFNADVVLACDSCDARKVVFADDDVITGHKCSAGKSYVYVVERK